MAPQLHFINIAVSIFYWYQYLVCKWRERHEAGALPLAGKWRLQVFTHLLKTRWTSVLRVVKSIENRRTNLIESNMIFFWVWESGQAHYWNVKEYHDIFPSGYALVHPTAYRWQVQSVALRLYAAKPNLDIYVSLVYAIDEYQL